MQAHIPYVQNYVDARLHCSHLESVLFVASQFIGIDHFLGYFLGNLYYILDHICHWAYLKMPAMLNFGYMYVTQNDGPMADNEKLTKIGAVYYVKVVDASFQHFHGTLNKI